MDKNTMKQTLLLLLLWASPAMAAKLNDVKILEVNSEKNKFEFKLHANVGAPDSFFFVAIQKSEADSFDQLAILMKKLQLGKNFNLSLDIKNFSPQPSGSYYLGKSVIFSGK
jgi:hypothetical protein